MSENQIEHWARQAIDHSIPLFYHVEDVALSDEGIEFVIKRRNLPHRLRHTPGLWWRLYQWFRRGGVGRRRAAQNALSWTCALFKPMDFRAMGWGPCSDIMPLGRHHFRGSLSFDVLDNETLFHGRSPLSQAMEEAEEDE